MFADDLIPLAAAETKEELQFDLQAMSNYVETNEMSLAPEFGGTNTECNDDNTGFEEPEDMKDLFLL